MTRIDLTRRQALLAAGSALAAGAVPAAAQEQRRLTVAMSGYPVSIEPVMQTQTATRRIVPQLFDTLIGVDHGRDMTLRPALAERWERLNARALKLSLRRGVTFHDGAPFTADDVAFSLSLDHLLGPGRAGQTVAMQTLEPIERVEIVDPFTVVVHAKGDDALLERRIAGWSSEIVSKRAFAAAGSWDRWQAAPVGTGPYRLVEQRTDVRVLLAAHEGYWGGPAPFTGVEFRIVPELASRMNGLLAGEFDIITDVAPDRFAEIERRPNLEVAGGAVQNLRFLVIDATTPALRDPRVRRALSLALDRRLLIDALWAGRLPVPNGFQLASFGASYVADFPALAHDPDAARTLLREAGYRGEPITYKLLNNYYPNQIATAQAMIEMWRAVGLNIRIEMMENFSQIYRRPVHAIFDSSSTAILPDHMGHAWREFGPAGVSTRTIAGWSNAEYQALGERMQVTAEPAERLRLHRRMLEILALDDPPAVILHVSGQFYGKRRDVAWLPGQTLDLDFGPFNPGVRRS
jgi:peptide/nickel transport system substrate-binding protein